MSANRLVQVFASNTPDYHHAFHTFLAHTDQKETALDWLGCRVKLLERRDTMIDAGAGEDDNRVSNRHGAENLALVRRLSLSLLKQHPDKSSIACKRLLAALPPAFLEEVIRQGSKPGKI